MGPGAVEGDPSTVTVGAVEHKFAVLLLTIAAIGLVQGVTQEMVATQPALVTEPSEVKRNEMQPSGLKEVIENEGRFPQKRSSSVLGAPTVLPYHTSR